MPVPFAAAAAGAAASNHTVRRAVIATVALFGLMMPVMIGLSLGGVGGAVQQQAQGCRVGRIVNAGSIQAGNLSAKQKKYAQVIAEQGIAAGVGMQGVVIALVTAMQESTLRNLSGGDRDSLGLFQQRPSTGWGSANQIRTPKLAAQAFYGVAQHTNNPGLTDIQGWRGMPVAAAAQAVQRSAFPGEYAKWEQAARKLAEQMLGDKIDAQAVAAGPGADAVTVAADDEGDPSGGESRLTGQEAKRKYGLGPVKPVTAQAVAVLAPKFGIETVGGWRKNDPYPDHPSGKAADFMVGLSAEGEKTGDRLAAYIIEHHQELGVKYLLWNQRSWYPGQGWNQMEDRGGPTANHADHLHLTLEAGGGTGAAAARGCAPAQGAPVVPVAKSGWAAPSTGRRTSDFGGRESPCRGCSSYHEGTDLAAGCGSPIYAANSGTVISSGPASGFGNWIRIDHGNNVVTVYGHIFTKDLLVEKGEKVKAGQLIAREGSNGLGSGCHVHFEVHVNGQPIDPEPFMAQRGVTLGGKAQGKTRRTT